MRALAGRGSGIALSFCLGLLAFAAPALASDESERLYSRALVEYHAAQYPAALELLNRAVAADPSDAYALYYRGVTHARLLDFPSATADLAEALRLNPEIEAANLELGVALAQNGQNEEAIPYLQRATQIQGAEGKAWLFLGISQLRLNRLEEARTSFEHASQVDPSLTLATQYYRGIVSYREQNWADAADHFHAVVAASPDSDMGREASEFLVQLEQGVERPYRLYGGGRFTYDSNVVLESDLDVGISRQDDGSFSMVAGGSYTPVNTDQLRLQVGYEFFQSLYFDLTDFNIQDHRPEVQISSHWNDLRFGLLGRYDYFARGLSDFSSFLQQGTAIPWFVWDEHAFGRTEVYYRFRLRDFLDSDFEERDGYNHAAGIRQFYYVSGPDNFLELGYQFDREDPEDDNLPFPEDPDRFAYDGHEVNTGVGWLLPLEVRGEVAYAYRHEQYPKNSLFVNSLNDDRPDRTLLTTEGREDNVHQVVVAFWRPIGEYFNVTASYYGTFNGSNDDQFDYDRHIVSVGVEVSY